MLNFKIEFKKSIHNQAEIGPYFDGEVLLKFAGSAKFR